MTARDKIIERFHAEYQTHFQSLEPHINYLLIRQTDFAALEQRAREAMTRLDEFTIEKQAEQEAIRSQMESALQSVRDAAAKAGVGQESMVFATQSEAYNEHATLWLRAAAVSGLLALAYAVYGLPAPSCGVGPREGRMCFSLGSRGRHSSPGVVPVRPASPVLAMLVSVICAYKRGSPYVRSRRVIGVRDLARRVSQVIDQVLDEGTPTLITKHGRPVALLVPVDEDLLEDFVVRAAEPYLAAQREADQEQQMKSTTALEDLIDEND